MNSMFARSKDREEITAHFRRGFRVLEVNCKKATYKGKPWYRLSTFDKRKYENLLVIENSQEPVKIIYTNL